MSRQILNWFVLCLAGWLAAGCGTKTRSSFYQSDGAETQFQLIFCVRQGRAGQGRRKAIETSEYFHIYDCYDLCWHQPSLTRWALCHSTSPASQSPVLAKVGGCRPVRAQWGNVNIPGPVMAQRHHLIIVSSTLIVSISHSPSHSPSQYQHLSLSHPS